MNRNDIATIIAAAVVSAISARAFIVFRNIDYSDYQIPIPTTPTMNNDDKSPRGIRNNNPGNIRSSNIKWQGSNGDDGEFIIFTSPVYGIRAIAKILATYRSRGITSLSDIVATWAPPNENDTDQHTRNISAISGLPVNAEINSSNMLSFIEGLIYAENGTQPYSSGTINRGIELA